MLLLSCLAALPAQAQNEVFSDRFYAGWFDDRPIDWTSISQTSVPDNDSQLGLTGRFSSDEQDYLFTGRYDLEDRIVRYPIYFEAGATPVFLVENGIELRTYDSERNETKFVRYEAPSLDHLRLATAFAIAGDHSSPSRAIAGTQDNLIFVLANEASDAVGIYHLDASTAQVTQRAGLQVFAPGDTAQSSPLPLSAPSLAPLPGGGALFRMQVRPPDAPWSLVLAHLDEEGLPGTTRLFTGEPDLVSSAFNVRAGPDGTLVARNSVGLDVATQTALTQFSPSLTLDYSIILEGMGGSSLSAIGPAHLVSVGKTKAAGTDHDAIALVVIDRSGAFVLDHILALGPPNQGNSTLSMIGFDGTNLLFTGAYFQEEPYEESFEITGVIDLALAPVTAAFGAKTVGRNYVPRGTPRYGLSRKPVLVALEGESVYIETRGNDGDVCDPQGLTEPEDRAVVVQPQETVVTDRTNGLQPGGATLISGVFLDAPAARLAVPEASRPFIFDRLYQEYQCGNDRFVVGANKDIAITTVDRGESVAPHLIVEALLEKDIEYRVEYAFTLPDQALAWQGLQTVRLTDFPGIARIAIPPAISDEADALHGGRLFLRFTKLD